MPDATSSARTRTRLRWPSSTAKTSPPTTAAARAPPGVGHRCLDLLAWAAEREPLLVIVDDAHWVDEASLEALRFAARRLDADRVGFLFAVRREALGTFADSGLELLNLGGLPDADAMALFTAFAARPVDEPVARAVAAATAGNPLALREAARGLSADQLAGHAPLPESLPGPTALQTGYASRFSLLAGDTRQALMLLAAGDAAPQVVLERGMTELALAAADFPPAIAAGLVRLDVGRFRFAHPLARAAVWHAAELDERRLAHRALATAWGEAEDPERAAWQLAGAAVGPDADAARAMAATAPRHGHAGRRTLPRRHGDERPSWSQTLARGCGSASRRRAIWPGSGVRRRCWSASAG